MSLRHPRVRLMAALVLFAACAVLVLGRGSSKAALSVAPIDPASGFPSWYEDAGGVRLSLCSDGGDPHCVLPAAGDEPGFDPRRPTSFPGNWPSEAFYALATSDIVPTPGCKGTRPGKASIRFALEAAFANDVPAAGDQITFGRVRLTVTSGLCPGKTYVFHHPYGDLTFTVDNAGALRRKDGTVDVGCGGTPCAFEVALGSTVLGGFLRWDPSISAPPAGTIGDGSTPHAVTGGSVRNFFSIEGPAVDKGPNVTVGETTLFTVAGKLIGPLTASPQAIAFGDQAETTTSDAQTITLENVGATPLTGLTRRAISGPGASAFAFEAGTCGDALAAHATCTIGVTFTPPTPGTKSATITIPHSGLNAPFSIALGGIGTTGVPAFAAAPTAIDFGPLAPGLTSETHRVTVANDGGTAPLSIAAVALAGGTDFRIASETCLAASPLAKDATCHVDLAFSPAAPGAKADALRITDGGGTVHTVALSGTASRGSSVVSSEIDADNGFAAWYEDGNGNRLEQCIDGTDPNCVLPAAGEEPGFDPARPAAFPENFPSEFFYWVATSDPIPTRCDRGGAVSTGKAYLRAAVEGAFANGDPSPGDQVVFGRVRFFADGLCPNTTYTFVHPYGETVITTNSLGVAARSPNTEDIGCLTFVPPATCDFTQALGSPVLRSFLRWGSGAPEGYLGDGITPHTVVGAPSGHNFLRIVEGSPIAADSIVVGETDLFSVSGRKAGPIHAAPSAVDFAGQEPGVSTAARIVTITNLGLTRVTLGAVGIGGVDAGDFARAAAPLTGVACAAGLALDRDETCEIAVVFTPSRLGKRSASVTIGHDGLRSPATIALVGTGIAGGAAPTVTATPSALDFGDQRVHTFGLAKHVTVGNDGSAPLAITGVALTRSDRGDFLVSANDCDGAVLDPGSTCGIDVRFGPTAAGPRSAGLTIDSNAGNTTVDLTGNATGGLATLAGGRAFGYPLWFEDESRIHVIPCLDATDAQCILPAAGDEPGYDPTLDLALPGNFPSEFFYTLADSDVVATPGCTDTTPAIAPGRAFIRVALEGAFANGSPAPGDQMVFGRVRIVVKGGLCPGVDYTFVHPYGVATLTADAAGGIKPTAGTVDVGCLGAPCTFADALSSHIAGNVLRWPAGSAGLPAGYLGDVAVAHAVTGSPLGQNLFRIERSDDGTLVGTTDQFFVSGKLATPAGVPAAVDLGTQASGTTGPATLVTVTNLSSAPLTLASLTTTGPFTVVAGPATTCSTAAALAVDATCVVAVTFSPLTSGVKAGTLAIAHDGVPGAPVTVVLSGTGTDPAPVASLDTTALAFGSQRVGTTGAAQVVTITNAGGGSLALDAPATTGDYVVTATTCGAPVAAAATCTISVAFRPTATGARTGTLSVTSNAVGSPHRVTLSGTGIQPAIAVNRTQIGFGQVAVGTTSTQTMTVTNTGTASLTLSAVSTAAPFGLGANACQGIVIPVGGTCQITVTYTPSVGGNSTGAVAIVSDAPGAPTSVGLTGSGQVAGGPAPTTISFGATTVDFGGIRAGGGSSTKSVSIRNTGAAPLSFSPAPAITGSTDFAIVSNTCGAVAAGGSCRIDIRFTPTGSAGARSASLTLSWNGGVAAVALTGTVR